MFARYPYRMSEECATRHVNQLTRSTSPRLSGLSPQGYLATIANRHSVNGRCLIEAKNELAGEADQFVLHGKKCQL